jgi:hypothetical protein
MGFWVPILPTADGSTLGLAYYTFAGKGKRRKTGLEVNMWSAEKESSRSQWP